MNGEAIEKIIFSLHRPPDDPDEEEPRRDRRKGGGRPVRFLIDLTLSVLGPVQIDGLANPGEQRFDLVLRTRTPLPQEIRRDIIGLFANAGTVLNLGGSLHFQVTERFAAPPPEERNVPQSGSLLGMIV